MLHIYGVSGSDITAFFAYITLGLTLPGVLLIRLFYRGPRSLAEEFALGLALGYALQVPTYIAARAIGVPLLVLVFPLGTYLLFLAFPGLRSHWRGAPRRAAPLWWSWSIALTILLLIAWSAATFFGKNALAWPALGASNVDASFHLALIGELKHHMPPEAPMVAGEPLLYHWFVHAHLAATSWVTGVEPVVLLLRLGMLPMLAALVLLLSMVALRVIRSRPAALMAVLAAIFTAAPNLYLGDNGILTWGGIQDAAWISPSQTFGAVLFAPAALLLFEILEEEADGSDRWPLLTVFLIAIMGAKATYLPLLAAGLLALIAVEAVRSRRRPRSPLIALGMTAVCLLCAHTVLFKGAQQGVGISPFSIAAHLWQSFAGRPGAPPPAAVIGLALVYLMCWAVSWCGVLGLLSRPRLLLRPSVIIVIAMGCAGLGTALLLGNIHLNQLYFLRAACPYMAIVSVYGLLVAVRASGASPVRVTSAVGAGVAAAYAIPVLCGVTIPLRPGQPAALVYLPAAVLLGLVTVTAIALLMKRNRTGWALALSAVTAIGLPGAAHARILSAVHKTARAEPGETAGSAAEPDVPQGALVAGRWLRDHSSPDDLIATNDHSRWAGAYPCDRRHSWVSALTERRVLVEGWAYIAKNWERLRPDEGPECTRFWDPERLRANDTAFAAPSRDSIQRLRDDYGVRWLFADQRHPGAIANHATLRFRSGDFAVYQIPD
ncbi:hypothetical protein ACQP2K_27585 [Microbispora siamensis]